MKLIKKIQAAYRTKGGTPALFNLGFEIRKELRTAEVPNIYRELLQIIRRARETS